MIKPALLFGCLFLLSSLSLCEGQSQLIGPSQPIVAIVGGHIFLPSHLEPAVDAVGRTVEWTRPDLDHRFVHVWRRDGVEVVSKKHLSYEGRTSLFLHKLMNGDVSLKLSEVKLSDEGKYQCFIPSLDRESIVELVVDAHMVTCNCSTAHIFTGVTVVLLCICAHCLELVHIVIMILFHFGCPT
uniref:Ig-like domain-containing protein n=1 Tax=Myripristis murdjan TaxID=586833 RepID=A0A667Z1Y2_9TELE